MHGKTSFSTKRLGYPTAINNEFVYVTICAAAVSKITDGFAYADLAAERPFVAERADTKIIVEAKSFAGPSVLHDFKLALGQYDLYQPILAEVAPEYKLYLAVSDVVYASDFQRNMVQFVLRQREIPLIVVDIVQEEVVQWIN